VHGERAAVEGERSVILVGDGNETYEGDLTREVSPLRTRPSLSC